MSSVQSVARAFTILQAVAAEPAGLSVTQIARQVDIPKSTVSRLLATLESFAAVERLPDSDGVRIGNGIVSMALQLPFKRYLAVVAQPIMLDLADVTGEAVGLCLPDGDRVYYVDQVQSHHHVQVRDWTGACFPMHIVSAGKLFMAEWDANILDQYLASPLEQYTPHTVVDMDALQAQLSTIRETGVSWTVDEFEVGLTAVSAPVRDDAHHVMAAVNVYGPSFRFPAGTPREAINKHVIAAAKLISKRMQRLQ